VTSEAHLELKLLGGFEARLQAGAALVLSTILGFAQKSNFQ
jgi:hypothetical protein